MAIIKLKRSETAATAPASLQYGEVAINVTDKKIYIGNSSGATTLIVDGNASGYTAPTLGSTTLTSGATITSIAGLTSVTSTSFVGALTGNASTVTNGVYTTDTGTVTNTMLAGSIANNKLTNSSITVNGSSISLGGSATVTANTTNALTIGTGLSGTSFNGSGAVTIAIDSTVATLTGGQTLTNKTISGSSNTLSNIANASLTNSSITINGSTISLGGSATVTATATNALTLGTGLTGTSYNGSTAVTAAVDTSTIATRAYVDTVAQGLHTHATAKTATTATLATLTGTTVSYAGGAITWTGGNAANGASFNDGTTLTANTTEASADRILVKNEGGVGGLGASKNGTYYVYAARELRRTSDGDAASDWLGGDFCFVTNGTLYADTGWVQTEVITTLDTDSIIWQQFSGAGSFTADETTLTLSGSQFSIKSTYVGQTSITTLGTIATGTWNATAIGETRGGTNQTTYATGDLLYASATNTLSKLAKPASLTSFLQMTSAGVPSWTSTIPTTNGGTGLTSFTSGGLVYASSTSALTTGTVFDIDSSATVYRINIASGATPRATQEFKVSETAFNSSAAIGVYTDVTDNPPGSLGQAYVNLASTTGTDSQIVLASGAGSVTFAGGTTPLTLTTTPSLWGSTVGVLYCIDDALNPYIIFGDDGTNNTTSIKITDTLSTMVVTAATLKINTSTPSAGEVLTCTSSDGTCEWQDNTGATLALYNMGFI
jgi:hypothetical protein